MSDKKKDKKSKSGSTTPKEGTKSTELNNSEIQESPSNTEKRTEKLTEEKFEVKADAKKEAKPTAKNIEGNLSFGAWLQKKRNDQNISLEEIAAVTKVHIHQLKTIEDDKWNELPAPAFVRGFLVCYARHLNLNEDDILKRYKEVMGPGFKTIEAALPAGLSGVQSSTRPKVGVASTPNFQKAPGAKNMDVKMTPIISPKKLGIIVAIILVIAFLFTLISVGKEEQNQETEQKASELTQVEEPKQNLENTPAVVAETKKEEAKAETIAPPQNKLIVYGIDDTWIKAKVDDKNSRGASIKKGQIKTYYVYDKIKLVLSNAGAVELKWNNIRYAAPGFRGDVKTIILPDHISKLEKKKWPKVKKPNPPASSLPGSEPALSSD